MANQNESDVRKDADSEGVAKGDNPSVVPDGGADKPVSSDPSGVSDTGNAASEGGVSDIDPEIEERRRIEETEIFDNAETTPVFRVAYDRFNRREKNVQLVEHYRFRSKDYERYGRF